MDYEVDKHKGSIVLVGDTGVGKTHLMNIYVVGQPPKYTVPTIGIEFGQKPITLQDGGKGEAYIWDTAGQERYRGITTAHLSKAGGALVVYDITKERTFESVKYWMELLKKECNPEVVIFLIGNKVDLVEKDPQSRKVTFEDGQRLAASYTVLFYETSAFKFHANEVICFDKLIEEMSKVRNKLDDKKSLNIVIEGEIKN